MMATCVGGSRPPASSTPALAEGDATSQPAVSNTMSVVGWVACGIDSGPASPGKPGSPPARCAIAQQKFHASSRLAARAPSQLCESASWLPPRLIAPRLGLKPTQPQKLAGRMIEPTTCGPKPAEVMPAATAPAEPPPD